MCEFTGQTQWNTTLNLWTGYISMFDIFDNSTKMIKSFLLNRSQFVSYNEFKSRKYQHLVFSNGWNREHSYFPYSWMIWMVFYHQTLYCDEIRDQSSLQINLQCLGNWCELKYASFIWCPIYSINQVEQAQKHFLK